MGRAWLNVEFVNAFNRGSAAPVQNLLHVLYVSHPAAIHGQICPGDACTIDFHILAEL